MKNTEKSTKRGRPIVAGSKRQDRVAAMSAKIAAGIEIKRGRPKGEPKVKAVKAPKAEAPKGVKAPKAAAIPTV
jgi:hypothetical protein